MVALIHRMHDRQKKILNSPTGAEREIQSIDSRINAQVYELYGLTREEAGFVESRTRDFFSDLSPATPTEGGKEGRSQEI